MFSSPRYSYWSLANSSEVAPIEGNRSNRCAHRGHHHPPHSRRLGRVPRFVLACLMTVGWSAVALADDMAFSNQTAAAGLSVTHNPTYTDSFVAGGAIGDFNVDGFQDIYFAAGGGGADRLYLNNGDGTFTNQASAWGLAITHQSTAGIVGDYDNDGFPDLVITRFGGPIRLFHNDGGVTFSEVSNSGLVGTSSHGGAFGDYDLDGDLDLAVCSWSTLSANRLFRNNGDGTFTNVTSSSGVQAALASSGGVVGFTTRFADMNDDRYPELLWVGDFGTSRYLRNNGNGTFTNITASAGVGFDGTEMGHTVADFDRDGRFDWYVTTINTNNLYRNLGNHAYQEISSQAGVTFTGWGWGTVACDFDHDTRVDIAATSQSGGQYLYRNVTANPPSNLTFNISNSGFTTNASGRGLANFDYDNDGDQDLLILPFEDPIQLFRNDTANPACHWIRIFLDSRNLPLVPPAGIGSKVIVEAGGVTQIGRVDGGNNYLSQSELSAHFGLGSATSIDSITVQWSDGTETVFEDVAVDQTITLAPPGPLFRRGDSNGDGAHGLPDVILMLGYMFQGLGVDCERSLDVNADDGVSLPDAILLLNYLFLAGTTPQPPSTIAVKRHRH